MEADLHGGKPGVNGRPATGAPHKKALVVQDARRCGGGQHVLTWQGAHMGWHSTPAEVLKCHEVFAESVFKCSAQQHTYALQEGRKDTVHLRQWRK